MIQQFAAAAVDDDDDQMKCEYLTYQSPESMVYTGSSSG